MRRALSPTDTQAGQDRCEAHHGSHTVSRKATSWRQARGGGGEPRVHPQRAGSPLWAPSPRSLSSPIPPPRPPEGPGGAGRGGCREAASGPPAPRRREPGRGWRPVLAGLGTAQIGSDPLGSARIGSARHCPERRGARGSSDASQLAFAGV